MTTTPNAPQPPVPPSNAELPIQEATLELIRWFIPVLHRLPRQHHLSSWPWRGFRPTGCRSLNPCGDGFS